MKKLLCLLLLLLLLTGCASVGFQKNAQQMNLMPGAKPETSALGLYIYDGETLTRRFLFETDAVREDVMEDFWNARVVPTEVDVTTLRPPYYGLEMGGEELGEIQGLWADGFFIMGNGKTYAFDYDFETLLADYPWDTPDTFQALTVMPCASHIAKTEIGWNPNFLTPAEEKTPPDGITMELIDRNSDAVTVRFTNCSGEEWGYGYAFGLEVLLDDTWYYVPAEEEMAFIEILCMLPDSTSAEETYGLDSYGTLPAGIYRLASEGMTVEFTIE